MLSQLLNKGLLLLTIGMVSMPTYAMSFTEATVIFNRLSGASNTHLILEYSSSNEINAYEHGYTVTVNAGMLRFVRNTDELAMVLGHEIGHYKLGHFSSTPPHEYAADAYGANLTAKAGYNRCRGALIIYRFHDSGGSTHPSSDSRYARIKC